jgi:hypothetical protein
VSPCCDFFSFFVIAYRFYNNRGEQDNDDGSNYHERLHKRVMGFEKDGDLAMKKASD